MKTKSIRGGKDSTVALSLDTLKLNKQALIFCSSKRAAESQAEKISKQVSRVDRKLQILANEILMVLANPTKQCKRLASCVEKGIAFHHAGLNNKQREIIEDNFRNGVIKIIASTPTLAAGLDLPAFRAIIRDNKRFGARGMAPIPVLEYLQMCGRAGRPGQEDYGEAILIANKESDVEALTEQFIFGEVESIYSKLAVEPVLRTYILSLVSAGIIKTTNELYDFFDNTFYAQQFGDVDKLHITLRRMIKLLKKWKFLEEKEIKNETTTSNESVKSMFQTATQYFKTKKENEKNKFGENEELNATMLGSRVSQMYLDPLTANMLLKGISKIKDDKTIDQTFGIIHLLTCSLEMRPLLRTKVGDVEFIQSLREEEEEDLLIGEEKFYELSGDDFDDTIKTSQFFMDWINETTEDKILEKYDVRPGEITYKQNNADWLLYACEELARITEQQPIIKIIKQVRTRVKHGVKKELLALLRFKGIGRVRARKLYNKGIKTVKEVRETAFGDLVEMIGIKLAQNIKEEVGENVTQKDIDSIVQRARRIHSAQTNLGEFK